jgi:hypothetical protein
MNMGNGIATGVDFRRLAEASAWTEPEEIKLPKSGLSVALRRPTKFYWALHRTAWPGELREKLDQAAVGIRPELSQEETLLLAREDRQMLLEAFVKPPARLEPGPEQFDPNWLAGEDLQFIFRYLRGQVLASGQDLEQFPGSEQSATGSSSLLGENLLKISPPGAKPGAVGVADK